MNFCRDLQQYLVASISSCRCIDECPGAGLELKWLDLHDNLLGNRAVDALVNLANSDLLPQLQILNLGMNEGLDLKAFKSLMETIQRGSLGSLESLMWVENPGGFLAAKTIVQAYCDNEYLT
ncbi:unnamed protein product [Calypogeia fissa]